MTVLTVVAAVLVTIVLFVAVANEAPGWATISFLLFLVAGQFLFELPIYQTVVAYPLTILGFAGLYLAVGVAWSFPKWWFFVRKVRDDYLESLTKFLRRKGIGEGTNIPDHLVQVWQDEMKHTRWNTESIPPRASEHKTRIILWMMYWPVSMVWTMIDEPFRRSFLFIFERVRGLYQRISESAFSDLSV